MMLLTVVVSVAFYQTLYDYNSGEDGDLSFKANEIIRVTDEGILLLID